MERARTGRSASAPAQKTRHQNRARFGDLPLRRGGLGGLREAQDMLSWRDLLAVFTGLEGARLPAGGSR